MSFPRRRESGKINELDPRLRGDDDYFSISSAVQITQRTHDVIEAMLRVLHHLE